MNTFKSAWNRLVRGDESVQKLIRLSMFAQCPEIILQIYSSSGGKDSRFSLLYIFGGWARIAMKGRSSSPREPNAEREKVAKTALKSGKKPMNCSRRGILRKRSLA